eukprot:Skav204360  [mRNA]  locus=scaffold866:48799:49454:+ [translate_table: standard]
MESIRELWESEGWIRCKALRDLPAIAEVIHSISIETAEFSVASDRDALLLLVDRLFTSRREGRALAVLNP